MSHRILVFLFLLLPDSAWAQDELSRSASWKVPSVSEFDSRLAECLTYLNADSVPSIEETANADRLQFFTSSVTKVWPDFEQLRISMNSIDTRARHLEIIEQSHKLASSVENKTLRDAIKTVLIQWLVQHQLYDEAILEAGQIDWKNSLFPETILFFQATSYHQLLKKSECLATVETLLENENRIPTRYQVVSKLMAADIGPLKEDSLDEVARLMSDIRRRQFLYRSGRIVRDEEQLVMSKLDRLIEDLEARLKSQQQQSGQQSSGGQPMQESGNAAGLGTGEIRKKTMNEGGDWGNLPPAERAKALAEMAKDFPPHYRSVIEEYFRKLADDDK